VLKKIKLLYLLPALVVMACNLPIVDNFFERLEGRDINTPSAQPVLPTSTEPGDSSSIGLNPTICWGEEIPVGYATNILSLDRLQWINDREAATFLVHGINDGRVGDTIYKQFTHVYVLAAPFPTIADNISGEELRLFWQGQKVAGLGISELIMSEDTRSVLSWVFGVTQSSKIRIVSAGETLDDWVGLNTWAILSFEQLTPRWKVISIDGVSPLDPTIPLSTYPLAIPYYLSGKPGSNELWNMTAKDLVLVDSNREAMKMTRLVMTGVTALVRAIAFKMEVNGITYPARDIGDWLRLADITHISNEVSFVERCPAPEPGSSSLIFCSHPEYIGLLEDVGADVIELTGNHLNDWNAEGINLTLNLYKEHGWQYFGGGSDLADSRKAALFEHNGNRIAFIGCNAAGPDYGWAAEGYGGAAPCGDYGWLIDAIRALDSEGYQVVVTIQYFENYSYHAGESQRSAFQPLADAGAVIVQGSQAHTPKEMEFRENGFIHYGLGNLFFDQMNYYEFGEKINSTREEFIDRYVFYDNHLISIELLTAMLEDYSKPRPMNLAERQALLNTIYSISKLD
jgi:hypothetical protein